MHKIFEMNFTTIYQMYVKKAERKGRSEVEVIDIICWFTGDSSETLRERLTQNLTVREFFETSPQLNEARHFINGSICGVEIQEIEDSLMKEVRYLDKLIDELAKGKAITKIKRNKL